MAGFRIRGLLLQQASDWLTILTEASSIHKIIVMTTLQ